MDGTAIVLALVNCVQVLVLAYIALRQAEVKRDLNGTADATIAALERIHGALDTKAASNVRS